MPKVLGLGDAGIDIILHVPKLPEHDEKILATKIERHAGGVIANFLTALSVLGTSAGFLGCLGKDQYGEIVISAFQDKNIDISRLKIKEEGETYFCVSMLDDTGEKALVIGATDTIFPEVEDIDEQDIRGAELIHTTGLNLDTAIKAAGLAKKENMLVSLDLEPSTLSKGIPQVKELVELTDLLFVNSHTIQEVFPRNEDPVISAGNFLDWGPDVVVFTRGVEGSAVITREETLLTPGFQVKVVDTTGAGDCFNAAFIHGYLQGWDTRQTAVFANAAAAISITRVGAQTALPTQAQVESFLAERQLDLDYPDG